MFSLATAKGRFSSIAVVALAVTMAACPNSDELDGVFESASPSESDVAAASPAGTDASTSPTAEVEAAVPTLTEFIFGECHDTNAAGGNSDGWFYVEAVGGPPVQNATVEVDLQDRGIATYPGASVGDGWTFVFPLDAFGQEVAPVTLLVDGVEVSLDAYVGDFPYVVDPASDCTYHPDFYENL